MAEKQQPLQETIMAQPPQGPPPGMHPAPEQVGTTPAHGTSNATATAPQNNNGGAKSHVDIDQQDIQYWMDRFNEAAADANGHIHSKSPAEASTWSNGFFSCFSPISTCLVGYFLPCVAFSRTYHRLHKDADLKDWKPVNASCLMFCGSTACLPLWAIPLAIQRSEIRSRFNLQGGCLSDMLWGCCCSCCSLIQMDKEVADRQKNMPLQDPGYQTETKMMYPGH